ncbi:UNVERIFIED_ORG: META domain-containing protein [Bacillus sp. AZ43]
MRRVAILLLASGLLAACGAVGGGPDIDGEWEFAEGTADGADLPRPQGAGATLRLDGGEVDGVAFCNSYFSSYRVSGSSFSVDGIGQTEMGCEPAVMAAEAAYLAALAAVSSAATTEDGLVLTGDGVELRFTPVAPVPDSELAGTRWVLESLVDGETMSSTSGLTGTLQLDRDSTAEATTGCRTITGTWLEEDDRLVIDDLLASGECTPDAERQDAHVTAVLASGPTLAIEEDRLTLTADDGRGLVYRAAA